jgi:hypothetical protein
MSLFQYETECNIFRDSLLSKLRRDTRDNYTLDSILRAYDSIMWAQEGAQLSQDLREVFKNELLKQKAPELESGGEILAPIPPSVAIVSSVPPPRGGYKKIPGATRLTFNQECHKRGKAAERYDKFKVAKTVDEYKKLNPEKEQQKDLEHAIVNKLVKIDTIDLGDEHESALTWINKFIEKSSTTKEKKPTKKTKAVTNDDEVQSLAMECQSNMFGRTSPTGGGLSAPASPSEEKELEEEQQEEEQQEEEQEEQDEHSQSDDEEAALEEYLSGGEKFFIDKTTNQVYKEDEDKDYELVGDINSHPEDEEEEE